MDKGRQLVNFDKEKARTECTEGTEDSGGLSDRTVRLTWKFWLLTPATSELLPLLNALIHSPRDILQATQLLDQSRDMIQAREEIPQIGEHGVDRARFNVW